MSLRILPPPLRHPRWFEDGDVPLSAKAIDDDYFLPRVTLPARISTQPITDDDFPQIVVTALDDDSWRPSITPAPVINSTVFLSDDEAGQGIIFTDEDVPPPRFATSGTITRQPIFTEDDLPFVFGIDDDAWLPPQRFQPAITAIEPIFDDEISGSLKNFGVDDDAGQWAFSKFFYGPFGQPILADEDLPFVIALDDDGFFIVTQIKIAAPPQPMADDETTGVLKNFGLDDDATAWTLGKLAAAILVQPIADDDAAPQFVITIVDEDGFVVGSWRATQLFAQPLNANDDLTQFLGFDDDAWFEIRLQPSQPARAPISDDEILPQTTIITVDEDAAMVAMPSVPLISSQQLFYEEIVIEVAAVNRSGGSRRIIVRSSKRTIRVH